jgi:hypothetical protein
MAKDFKIYTLFLLAVVSFASCKKTKDREPELQNSVNLYNWFTSANSSTSTYWIRNNENYVWTFYASGSGTTGENVFKVFNNQNKYVRSHAISFADLYPQGYHGFNGYYY